MVKCLHIIISATTILSIVAKYFNFKQLSSKKKLQDDLIKDITDRGKLHDLKDEPSAPTDECLLEENAAKEVLDKLNMKKLYPNKRFILGKCNPVLLVPGVFGSRLVLRINCKEFQEDKQKAFEMKYFCKQTICKPSFFKSDIEEHVLWPVLFDSPFKLYQDEENEKNACFGYFMQYYNTKEECPKMNLNPNSTIDNENYVCRHHPSVKITFYGGTDETESKSRCGLRGIEKILASGKTLIKDEWINSGAPVGFYEMRKRFEQMGYTPGFSLAGLPYDFRRWVMKNEDFVRNFNYLVNQLYENTGKKVIVIGHSFGTVNTLNMLISNKESQLSARIERFIAIAPPFAGASKAVETMTAGTQEFRNHLLGMTIDIDIYAQKLFATVTPSSYELMMRPQIENLIGKKEYNEFISSIKERIDLEDKCKNDNCSKKFIQENSKLFSKVFSFMPQLDETSCTPEDKSLPKFKDLEDFTNIHKEVIYNSFPTYSKCKLRMYDYYDCPIVVYSDNHDRDIKNYTKFCSGSNVKEQFYVTRNCTSDKSKGCIKDFVQKEGSFGWGELNKSQGIYETAEEHRKNIERFFEYQTKYDKISSFDHPDIPTTVIYSSMMNTRSAYLFEKGNSSFQFNSTNVHYNGGDGTVPAVSSLFPPLKWAYDKYLNSQKHGIQFVEYCTVLSLTSKYGYQKFSNISNENHFIALGCDCLEGDTLKLDKIHKANCAHSTMINDQKLISFVENVVSLEPESRSVKKMPKRILRALENHESNDGDYEDTCNRKIMY